MAIKTVASWQDKQFDDDALREKLFDMVRTGVTDRYFTVDEDQNTVRVWTTVEAAQEWIDYLNSFTPPPVVAKVVQD